MQRLIVCAAIRNPAGTIVCGPRHGDCINSAIAFGLDPHSGSWECGFVDQDGIFLSRKEAWEVADAAGQIRRPTGYEQSYDRQRKPGIGDKAPLFSENLY